MDMEQFKRIPEVSSYNHNFHIWLDWELLFAHSDDDGTTEWFIVGNRSYYQIGFSFCSNDEKLVKGYNNS